MITQITYTDDETPDTEYRWERSVKEPFHWALLIKHPGSDRFHVIRTADDPDPHTSMEVLWNMALGTTKDNEDQDGVDHV